MKRKTYVAIASGVVIGNTWFAAFMYASFLGWWGVPIGMVSGLAAGSLIGAANCWVRDS